MRFNSVKSSDYSTSAKAVTRNMDAIFDASIKSRPDFTKISTAAQKGRSAERQAVAKAEGTVDLAGIKADALNDRNKILYDADKKVADIKKPAQRMAGVVGGLGALSSFAIMAKNNKEDDEAAERMEALYAARTKEMSAAINASKPEPYKPGSYEGTPYTPLPSAPSSSSSQASSVSSATPSRKAAFNEILESAKRVGGSNFPEVVAAQAMHETGWLSSPNSVYMSSNKTNPYGQTGDRGYGTLPRKGFKDGWTLYPDLDTATADHIKLWHDTKNHSGNYNAFSTRDEGIKSVAPAYSPNADPENIRLGYTVTGYQKGVNSALREMGYIK